MGNVPKRQQPDHRKKQQQEPVVHHLVKFNPLLNITQG